MEEVKKIEIIVYTLMVFSSLFAIYGLYIFQPIFVKLGVILIFLFGFILIWDEIKFK